MLIKEQAHARVTLTSIHAKLWVEEGRYRDACCIESSSSGLRFAPSCSSAHGNNPTGSFSLIHAAPRFPFGGVASSIAALLRTHPRVLPRSHSDVARFSHDPIRVPTVVATWRRTQCDARASSYGRAHSRLPRWTGKIKGLPYGAHTSRSPLRFRNVLFLFEVPRAVNPNIRLPNGESATLPPRGRRYPYLRSQLLPFLWHSQKSSKRSSRGHAPFTFAAPAQSLPPTQTRSWCDAYHKKSAQTTSASQSAKSHESKTNKQKKAAATATLSVMRLTSPYPLTSFTLRSPKLSPVFVRNNDPWTELRKTCVDKNIKFAHARNSAKGLMLLAESIFVLQKRAIYAVYDLRTMTSIREKIKEINILILRFIIHIRKPIICQETYRIVPKKEEHP
ncbi:hypothetical protein EVAR_37723_1 [Eumeta japonica]|uniref:Uncharacterized protein n=1 Tax=Eumeta variegata TaxID=151549 RepID=A0A4C1YPR2_EUMVA|nr:hypothetical protein EVAR_37723_1 [Eumeta japonica]